MMYVCYVGTRMSMCNLWLQGTKNFTGDKVPKASECLPCPKAVDHVATEIFNFQTGPLKIFSLEPSWRLQ
jgi:hypothetical protein